MKTLSQIFFILTAVVVLTACAKDELEGPERSAAPNAMIIDDSDAANTEIDSFIYSVEGDVPLASEVNDDGDDESAGSDPDTEKKK
jgi:hypothetical protein